jgi:hypothetical protein
MHRRLLDVALVAWLVVLLGTGLPQWVPGIPAVDGPLWRTANWIGLGQADWRLFAPDPDRINTWVEIELQSDQRTVRSWSTPNWQELSEFEKIQHIRWYKYADKLRRDDGQKLRKHALALALREVPPPEGETWVLAKMFRHFWVVPSPSQAQTHPTPKPWPPARDDYPRKVMITQKKLHDGKAR